MASDFPNIFNIFIRLFLEELRQYHRHFMKRLILLFKKIGKKVCVFLARFLASFKPDAQQSQGTENGCSEVAAAAVVD